VTADVDLKKGNQVNKPMLQNMFCGSSLAVLPLAQTVSEGELIVLLKRFNLDRKLAYQLITDFMLAFTRIYFLIVSRQRKKHQKQIKSMPTFQLPSTFPSLGL
jgi:hypothetical protein